MLKIGPIQFASSVVLAPMAGITDPPFRAIVRKYHPGLVCGEMISAMALHYNSEKTQEMIRVNPLEKPVSLQIFGSDPEIMAEAARIIEAEGADIIDINMGCPVPKIVKSGEGSALLNNLPLAGQIIEKVVRSINIPVTVKFRLGWDKDKIVAPEVARIAEDCGASAVTLHARTRAQFYQGKAEWDWIAKLKESITIPVIGNGDVNSPQSAQAMLDFTKCDGVMIGQASMGRPWLFHSVNNYLATGEIPDEPNLTEIFQTIQEHIQLQIKYSGEERGLKEMRKHLSWYLKGMPGAARMRDFINNLTNWDELNQVLQEFGERLTAIENGELGIEN